MTSNIYKALYLTVAIVATLILFLIYNFISNKPLVKYQMEVSAEGYVRVMNVSTGIVYFFDPDEGRYYYYDPKGNERVLNKLP